MGIEKQGSKGGNYVGGFLQMFDWNAKSRKKLFSSKSDIPEYSVLDFERLKQGSLLLINVEQSKQKKRCDGNLPTTRLQMLDEDESAAGSSVKGSSDYSCASSVIDDDFCGTKAPSVVARLMGLDSLPKSNMREAYSTPLFDSQSLRDSYYRTKGLEYCQDQIMHSSGLQDVSIRNDTEPKYPNVKHRPIEKFQTEILPPKSAKSIPITHHKLLSPIKSGSFIPSKDAAHIMEAAARIIEPGPQTSTKTKLPPVGSSVPLRVRDLKEKVQASGKQSKLFEGSQRKTESRVIKNLSGHSMDRSWNGSADAASVRVTQDSEESSVSVKSKGKSISLALQAKANVQKREGLNVNGSRSLVSQKEPPELSPGQLFKVNQQHRRVCSRNNLHKMVQVCSARTIRSRIALLIEENFLRNAAQKVLKLSMENLLLQGNGVLVNLSVPLKLVPGSWAQRLKMKREKHYLLAQKDLLDQVLGDLQSRGRTKVFSSGSQSKRALLSLDGSSAAKFSFAGHNIRGGDALSTLLEQKLKELAHKVEFSQQKLGMISHDSVPRQMAIMSSTTQEANKTQDGMQRDNLVVLGDMSTSDSNISQARKLLDCRLPSPVSVLEHSSFADSWNSSDSADSNSTGGGKQCSSVQAQEVLDTYSLKMFLPTEADAELSDSASSTSIGTVAKRQETTLTLTDNGKPGRWELQYVDEILCSIELMFKDYALGRAREIINPRLFDQLGSRNWHLNDGRVISRTNQRVLFDCVSECLELRCRKYVSGGCTLWAKGLSTVRRKERLAEEVYKEISGWSGVGDAMIDELVDKDMSSQYGRWLDFDTEAFELGIQIESRILNSLIDEVVADMLVL
ncbi:UNVERIFIED_CONTAM: hypothetical protein Sangu_1960700 [Sesamum angustifolium]|uniref:DUF4378 domain-containing protein n=1 Tax=Sesamum angustifolium TaxID=2727405 RepID=A0AAW2LWE8_9LAMI